MVTTLILEAAVMEWHAQLARGREQNQLILIVDITDDLLPLRTYVSYKRKNTVI